MEHQQLPIPSTFPSNVLALLLTKVCTFFEIIPLDTSVSHITCYPAHEHGIQKFTNNLYCCRTSKMAEVVQCIFVMLSFWDVYVYNFMELNNMEWKCKCLFFSYLSVFDSLPPVQYTETMNNILLWIQQSEAKLSIPPATVTEYEIMEQRLRDLKVSMFSMTQLF